MTITTSQAFGLLVLTFVSVLIIWAVSMNLKGIEKAIILLLATVAVIVWIVVGFYLTTEVITIER